MLTIKNLRKRYGNFQALDGLNLEVADGELFGFVGPNGAGKTTTLKILAGLLVPDEGEVEIGGLDVYSDGKELRRRIGYVPDFFGVYDNLKVSEYMEFFASCYGITGLQARTRCHTLLEQVRLEDKEDFFVDGLSRGMKQRLILPIPQKAQLDLIPLHRDRLHTRMAFQDRKRLFFLAENRDQKRIGRVDPRKNLIHAALQDRSSLLNDADRGTKL